MDEGRQGMPLSDSIGVRIAALIKEMSVATTLPRERDKRLHQAIEYLLTEVGADAVVFRSRPPFDMYAVFLPVLGLARPEKDEIACHIIDLADKNPQFADTKWGFLIGHDIKSGSQADILFCFPGTQDDYHHSCDSITREVFCYISFLKVLGHPPGIGRRKRWQQLTERNPQAYLLDFGQGLYEAGTRLIQLGMRVRAGADSAFSSHISKKFWDAADDRPAESEFRRPWEDQDRDGYSQQLTATLSVDLRSSTFVMDHAMEQGEYARWIEGFVLLIKEVVHFHGGVFDKFTGDGAIAHFPESCRGNVPAAFTGAIAELVLPALACAWEIVTAVRIYADDLLPYISVVNDRFGPSVGLAVDRAHWSADRAGNPIVVGRGVVHACRAGFGPSGSVYVTNGVFQAVRPLYDEFPHEYQIIDFVSKEYGEKSGVRLYQLKGPPLRIVRDAPAIHEVLDKVRRMLEVR